MTDNEEYEPARHYSNSFNSFLPYHQKVKNKIIKIK